MHSVYTFYLLELPSTSYNLPITGYLSPVTSYQHFRPEVFPFSFLSFLDHAAMYVLKAETSDLLIGGVNTE